MTKKLEKNFVQVWINQQLYFNNIVISRIESCQTKIKKYLDSSIGNLKQVYKSPKLYQTKQYANYKVQLKSVKTQITF